MGHIFACLDDYSVFSSASRCAFFDDLIFEIITSEEDDLTFFFEMLLYNVAVSSDLEVSLLAEFFANFSMLSITSLQPVV